MLSGVDIGKEGPVQAGRPAGHVRGCAAAAFGSQIVRPSPSMKVSLPAFLAFASVIFAAGITPAAEDFRRLSTAKIRVKFTGTEMTDNVHWRDGYRRDG